MLIPKHPGGSKSREGDGKPDVMKPNPKVEPAQDHWGTGDKRAEREWSRQEEAGAGPIHVDNLGVLV